MPVGRDLLAAWAAMSLATGTPAREVVILVASDDPPPPPRQVRLGFVNVELAKSHG
jgi:hypothetical protein